MKALALLLSLGFVFNQASAGEGREGGGGKGFLCRDDKFIEKVYLADTYKYVMAGGLKQFGRTYEADSVLKAVAELIEKSKPQKVYQHPIHANQKVSLAWMIEYHYQKLGWGIDFNLPDVADDNIDPMDVPAGCQKVQLAYTDISAGQMHANPQFARELTWVQRGFLGLHETLVSFRGLPGVDTTPIRKEVEAYAKLLDQNISSVSPMIRSLLLTGHKPGRTAAEEASLEFYEANNCHEVKSELFRKEDALLKKCRAADDVVQAFRERPYPRLKRFPQDMICKTTGVTKQRLSVKDPRTFKMTRIAGDGTVPGYAQPDRNYYRLDFVDQSYYSTAIHFSTEEKDGVQLVNSFARFSFQAVFEDAGINIYVRDYNERTQLFNGSLLFKDDDGNWTSYDFVCDGGPAEVGM